MVFKFILSSQGKACTRKRKQRIIRYNCKPRRGLRLRSCASVKVSRQISIRESQTRWRVCRKWMMARPDAGIRTYGKGRKHSRLLFRAKNIVFSYPRALPVSVFRSCSLDFTSHRPSCNSVSENTITAVLAPVPAVKIDLGTHKHTLV